MNSQIYRSARIKYLLADYRITQQAILELRRLGIKLINTMPVPILQKAVSGHPDMALHHLGRQYFCCPPQTAAYYQSVLPDAEIIVGNSELDRNYPADIAYNVGRVGNNAFHNFKYTDRKIYEYYEKIGVNLIHVNQGYSKCSICIVTSNAIITEDIKIAIQADLHGIDVLYLKNKSIYLKGMSCGFIGGAAGLFDQHTLLLNGSIARHPDCDKIVGFCQKYNVQIHSLHSGRIEDIGSLIPLSE